MKESILEINKRNEFLKASLTLALHENSELKDDVEALQAKLDIAGKALESIAYWKSDANVCCFPVDCYETLKQIRGEK